MPERTFQITVDIRTHDVDGNKINVRGALDKIKRRLYSLWNVSGFYIKEVKKRR